MDFTARMTRLLAAMRRERNGAVADAMRFYGAPYGLNYGTSLPTLRRIASEETPDHDFARYLYRQEVRELRLAALHIARPERFTPDEAEEWAAGIVNSEVAEEAAFALLSRSDALREVFHRWVASDNPLLVYAALLAAARSPYANVAWAGSAVEAVRRYAQAAREAADSASASGPASTSVSAVVVHPAPTADFGSVCVSAPTADSEPVCVAAAGTVSDPVSGSAAVETPLPSRWAVHLLAKGAVALLVAVGSQNEESRRTVLRMADSPGKLPAEDYVHEELAWRLEA